MILPLSILALCLSYSDTVSASSVWTFDIDNSPAPPPDQGPQFSAHALRDRSKLPYEVIGIIGAYLVCLLFSTIGILVVKRRLRRRLQVLKGAISEDITKSDTPQRLGQQPPTMGIDLGPLSPRKFTAWISPGKNNHSHHVSHASVSTVDEKVVEADRQRRMNDMAEIYAQVLQQDEERLERTREIEQGEWPLRSPPTSPISQRPPELQHLQRDPYSIKPSNHSFATTAVDDDQLTAVGSRPSSRKTKASPLSFLSTTGHTRTESANSTKSRPSRLSLKNTPISHPIPTPDIKSADSHVEEIPLSPRIYTPGPPPPLPGQRSAAAQARDAERDRFTRPGFPAPLRTATGTSSAHSLPFRQAYPDSIFSAPATKTVFLDRQGKEVNSGPKTGVPMTPYSPYMPYTPITPITPHLMSEDERKQQKKMKKKFREPISPEDVVPSDRDMWGKPV